MPASVLRRRVRYDAENRPGNTVLDATDRTRAGRLLITVAADVAQRRRARGLRLNHPEAIAILTSFVLEGARDGRTVADLMSAARSVLVARM